MIKFYLFTLAMFLVNNLYAQYSMNQKDNETIGPAKGTLIISGGRDDGYRGYTYKSNLKEGKWQVDVITEEELILGVIDFEIVIDSTLQPKRLTERRF